MKSISESPWILLPITLFTLINFPFYLPVDMLIATFFVRWSLWAIGCKFLIWSFNYIMRS